jgi:hypothetical protein
MVARLLSVSLILDHGNIFGKEDETGACDDEVLRCFEAISDPEEQSRFYAKHKKELMAASEARKNNPLTLTTMTKTQATKPKTPFPSAPLPWAWNVTPAGGVPTRERCLSVGTPKEKEQAVALVASYRTQEAISSENDINLMSDHLDKLSRLSGSSGGFEGEMMRRRLRAADHSKWEAAETRLAQLRQEAMDLITPVLRRLLVSYSESLAQAALEAEARLEANGLPLRSANLWTLHEDAVCRALWSCRVKVEKALFELHPLSAVGAVQFFLCSPEREPQTPFNWP